MDDLEYLVAAAKLANKGSYLGFHLPKLGSAEKSSSDTDDQLAIWKRLNHGANAAYGALYARVRTYFRLPEKSATLLQDAVQIAQTVAQKSPEKVKFTDLSSVLRWYLAKVATIDKQSRELVDAYIARMQELVTHSRILVEGEQTIGNGSHAPGPDQRLSTKDSPPTLPTYQITPPAGYTPKQGSGTVTDLETRFQTMRAMIDNAQSHLVALRGHLPDNAQDYVSRQAYEALLRDWNETQKAQHDRDFHSAMNLIQIITEIRHLYGVGSSKIPAVVGEAQVNFERAVDAMTSRLESLLISQYTITRMPIDVGSEFDPQIMKVEKGDPEPAPDASLVGFVAHVVTNGYWHQAEDGTATVFQKVGVIRYSSPGKRGS